MTPLPPVEPDDAPRRRALALYEGTGLSMELTEYRAPLTEAETEDAQKRIALGLWAVVMAKHCERPTLLVARA